MSFVSTLCAICAVVTVATIHIQGNAIVQGCQMKLKEAIWIELKALDSDHIGGGAT